MILIFVGSRANYGRLHKLIELLIENNYDIGIIEGSYKIPNFKDKVLYRIDNLMYYDKKENMVTSACMVANYLSNFIANLTDLPNLAIVHGDRFENLGFAMACAFNDIKLLHTEGGEDSGNIDDKIRNAITALSDYHCVTSKNACLKLQSVNFNVYNTGSPAIDAVKDLVRDPSNFILVLYNPCPEEDFNEFFNAILRLGRVYRVIWIQPNNDPGFKDIVRRVHNDVDSAKIQFFKDLNASDYYNLLSRCEVLVGNTSSGIKEGAYLEVPYILVGDRQSERETSTNVIRCECIERNIIEAIKMHPTGFKYDGIFGYGQASENILKIIGGIVSAKDKY